MPKVLSVFGTRPEAIKMAPVIRALTRTGSSLVSRICVTGQHRQMLDQVLSLFGLSPDIDLNLMQANQSLSVLAGRVLAGLDDVLAAEQPDIVLVQGDTTTAMAAALAAFHRRISVGHIEAGLRSGNRYSPFPEEINRRLASVLSNWHFAPTETARAALRFEGVDDAKIHVTGNPVIDALLTVASGPTPARLREVLEVPPEPSASTTRIILVTAHRRENHGPRMRDICRALEEIAARNPDVLIIYPVHLNPSVREPVFRLLESKPRIRLIEPVDYEVMAHLMKACFMVVTDSGGLQEEAPALGKPVLVLRDETERPEAVAAGVAKLVGTDPARILAAAETLLRQPEAYAAMAQHVSPYGDGHAAGRIATCLTAWGG